MRKRTSILDRVCFNYEQLFHPVQCTACKMCQCSSGDRLVLPEVTGILSILVQLHYLWCVNFFGNGTRQSSTSQYPSGSSHILFSYHYILSILGKIFLLWNQFFQCLAIVAFQLQSVQVFRETFSELEVQHDKVPILILSRERGFNYLQRSNSSWVEYKNNDGVNRWNYFL